MQALAEDAGGRALGPGDRREERPQGRRVASARRVEHLRHPGERGRLHRQGGEGVVELDAEPVAPDDDGEVGGRIAGQRRARQTARSTRPAARSGAVPVATTPACGTTESRTRRPVRAGCASA